MVIWWVKRRRSALLVQSRDGITVVWWVKRQRSALLLQSRDVIVVIWMTSFSLKRNCNRQTWLSVSPVICKTMWKRSVFGPAWNALAGSRRKEPAKIEARARSVLAERRVKLQAKAIFMDFTAETVRARPTIMMLCR